MKYQFDFGEVIRFAKTPNNETANLVGKLATITDLSLSMPDWYQTAITGDKWFPASEFEPVNGGMPKSAEHAYAFLADEEKMYDFLRISKTEFLASYSYLTEEEYDVTTNAYNTLTRLMREYASVEESTSESSPHIADELDFATITKAITGLDSCDFDNLQSWMNEEEHRRAAAERNTLIDDLRCAVERCRETQHLFLPRHIEWFDAIRDLLNNDFLGK